MKLFLFVMGLWAAAGLSSPSLAAETAGHAADEPILRILGEVVPTDGGDDRVFTLSDLRALESRSFDTSTIWGDGVRRFEGVSLDILLEHVGAEGSRLVARALNDYAIEIPMSDAVPGGALLAYALDGEPMSVRDKGPLWIVYPYDLNRAYANEIHYARSVWQLREIEVLD